MDNQGFWKKIDFFQVERHYEDFTKNALVSKGKSQTELLKATLAAQIQWS